MKFPRDQIDIEVSGASPALFKRFEGAKNLTSVSVKLHEGARVKVQGFGMPYANPGDAEVEGWVKDNAPVVGSTTLFGFLQQRAFWFAVNIATADVKKDWCETAIPPPFSYPYGTEHCWPPEEGIISRYEAIAEETKSTEQFRPVY